MSYIKGNGICPFQLYLNMHIQYSYKDSIIDLYILYISYTKKYIIRII